MRFILGLFAAVVIFTVQPVLAETYTERKEREALEAEAKLKKLNTVLMTVQDAYQAIPHQQTPFNKKRSKIPAKESKYLDHFFFVSDMALRARVMTLNYFWDRKRSMSIEEYNAEIDNFLSSFEFAKAPTEALVEAERLLIESIKEQQEFFNAWEKARGTDKFELYSKNMANHPKVKSSHGKLLQTYYILKAAYPREDEQNLQAFYDHLCALDFI